MADDIATSNKEDAFFSSNFLVFVDNVLCFHKDKFISNNLLIYKKNHIKQ